MTTIVVTLVTYQVVLLSVGWWARRRSQSNAAYFIGDRNLGPWVAALSYAAGSSSAWSILGVSGIAASQGLSAFWIVPGTLTGHVVVWFVLAPRLRHAAHEHRWITLTDLLVKDMAAAPRKLTGMLSALVILFCFVFYIAAQFQGAADTFNAVFGFEFVTALLLGVAVVLLYTFWGGFWAVSITDALQAVLMLIAALLLPLTALFAVGGFEGLVPLNDTVTEQNYWNWLGGHAGWYAIGFFLGMVSIGFGPLGQPHLLNRIMALKNPEDVRLARSVALTWFVCVLGGMFTLGLCAHVLLAGADLGEQVFFEMADQLLPAVLTGILIAAVLSAIMSTADSQLLVAGSAIQHDLLGGGSSARWAVAAVAVLATLLALFLPEAIFSRVLFAWNALGAAFGPLVIVRLLNWRVPDWSVPVALVTGFGLTVVFYSLPDGPGDLWERGVPFVAAFVVLGVTFLHQQTSSKVNTPGDQ